MTGGERRGVRGEHAADQGRDVIEDMHGRCEA
jgi:hypothetical protein